MKTKIKKQSANMFIAIVAVVIMFGFSSCATKAPFLSSSVVPAAEGSIKIKEDGNRNFVISVDISNLAESQRLTPPKSFYIVWMVTDNGITKNIGQIISSSKSISNRLKASFETVSSFKPTKIFITAENETEIQYPNSEVILTTDFIQ